MDTRKHCYHLSVLVTSVLLLGAASVSKATTKTPGSELLSQVQTATVPFIANQGQAAEGVEFYAYTFAGQVAISEGGEIHYTFHGRDAEQAIRAVVNETLVGGKISAVTGEQRTSAEFNHFIYNDPAQWHRKIPTYGRVSLGEVYDGVRLKMRAVDNNVEKFFFVEAASETTTPL